MSTAVQVEIPLGPFKGYSSRAPRSETPPGYFTADSLDWKYLPRLGKWKRRAGSAVKGDTLVAGVEVTGVLPKKWSAKGRQLFERSTVYGLWTNESTVWGQMAWYDANLSGGNPIGWQYVGQRMPSDYPLAGATTPDRFRMVPVFCDNALTYSRCANEKQARMLFAGSRNTLQVGNWLYAPNAQGTPVRCNLLANDASSTAQTERIFPTGHIPALMIPRITIPAATTVGTEPWNAEDRFICGMSFRFEDGSVSRPIIPQSPIEVPTIVTGVPQNTTGFVTALGALPGDAGKKYHYISWTSISRGPPGTKSRILWRTPKVTQSGIPSVYAPVNGVTMLQMGLVAEIPGNTFTGPYLDYAGNDASLIVDPINLRFADHMWPRRGRYMFSFDGHVAVCGALKANPGALIVGIPNLGGDEAISATIDHCTVRDEQVRVAGAQTKVLLLGEDANYPSTGIVLDNATTLKSVCTTIMSSLAAATVLTKTNWVAQIVPGANDQTTTDNIEYTQVYANFLTVNNNPTITVTTRGDGGAGNVNNIKVGMLLEGSGIPAGTYVGSVNTGAGTVGLVNYAGAAVNATATATASVRLGWDFGDVHPGEMRVFSCGYPTVLYFTKAYLDTLPTDYRAVDFTGADPGHPRDAANSWYVQNTRSVPATAGYCMGGGQVKNAGVVYYSRGKAMLTNVRAGKTGLDADWTMQLVAGGRGAISPSLVQGNGWVAALTPDGIEVTDDQGSRIISGELFDAGQQTGNLAYEISQCRIAAITDTDGGYFNMQTSGSRLRISYRSSLSVTYPDRYQDYDFSPSEGLYGLPEVLRSDGTPYGWSTPGRLKIGAMCEVQGSTAPHLYGMVDSNAGLGDGRVEEFETGLTDNGTVVAPIGYHSTLVDPDLGEFMLNKVNQRYKKNGTGLQIGLASDRDRGRVDYMSLDSSGASEFAIRRMPAKDGMGTPREVLEFVYADDGSGDQPEIHHGIAEVTKLVKPNTRR